MNSEFLSFFQFFVAILIFISLWEYSDYLDKCEFNKLVFFALLLVSSISVLQYYHLDGGLISEIRSFIHPGVYDLSDELKRDESITLSGITRPVGLAKESSYLSIFIVFCGYSILALGSRFQKLVFLMFLSFFFYTNTSPMLGIMFVIWGGHLYFNVRNNNLKLLAALWFFLMVFIAMSVLKNRIELVTHQDLGWDFLFEAYKKGLITTESSLGIRLFNPFITMANVLKENFLFGAGFSNIPYIELHSEALIFKPKNILSNALASGFIYVGSVGMILIILAVKPFLRTKLSVFVSYSIVLSFCGGGFFTIRYWSLLFLFLLIYLLSQRSRKNEIFS
ncbi:hypothetical protein HAX39_01875 [Citrobacter freundii]|nr:hypothetical protein [Citrobacter freundii]